MSRRSIVVLATAAFLILPITPAMADGSDNASCVGYGASRQAKAPLDPTARNFGQYTSSAVNAFDDPGVSGYVTFFAHIQPCE